MSVEQDQAEIRRLSAKRRALKAAPPVEPPVSKRLSLSEIITLLLQRQTRGPSGGVTLTRNAKGETQIEVSVPTGDECPTIELARVEAEAQYDALRAKYPPISPPDVETPKPRSRGRSA